MNEDEYDKYEMRERRNDKAASYDKPPPPTNQEQELIEAFKELLNWYGGVTEFEANMGSFWWTNQHGTTYTMIVHETN